MVTVSGIVVSLTGSVADCLAEYLADRMAGAGTAFPSTGGVAA
jgi:hypothetical protein